ncbi:MAG: LysR family transcriptional regulator, partial [Neisseria sp.]|nr:LysR family transcriptional regulator [Neisseria sp.]
MDTLFSLKVFRQVVESGSFTRAAEHLGISTAMASKHVSHLENTIRAKLLHRNSRNLGLTEAGEAYYRESSYALDTLANAAERAAQGSGKPQGELKITVPIWFANAMFAEWVDEYRRRYPEVSLNISLDNRHSNLIADGFDLALRITQEPSPSLIVRPLAEIAFRIVASPDYLAAHGAPQQPADLAEHQMVLPTYIDISPLRFRKDGILESIPVSGGFKTDNTLMVRRLALAGSGLAYQPYWLVRNDILTGRLKTVLDDYQLNTATLHAAYIDRAFLSAKVRSFIDFLSEKTQAL